MNNSAPHAEERQQSVVNVLMNASTAIRVTNEIVRDIELALLQPVDDKTESQAHSANLQSMDLLVQSLQEIERLLIRLAKATPNAIVVAQTDVVDPIRLEHLRRMIGGEADTQFETSEKKNTADISLF